MSASLQGFQRWIESAGYWAPGLWVLVFLAASMLMIWRLECMGSYGMEGTILGTLIMPYCSGMGNLVFAFLLGTRHGPGVEVLTNSLVNNVTNLTLLIGLPTIIWGLNILPKAKAGKSKGKGKGDGSGPELNRLSMLLTIAAAMFFTGALWALGHDGRITFWDGVVLVGLFLFWQSFQIYEVQREGVRQKRSFSWKMPLDLALLAVGAYFIYLSTDWLVSWLSGQHKGLFSIRYLGWLSGWLMVLPNALLAFYYGWRGNPEVVYASQVGDGHICIPLCVGIFALYKDVKIPGFFDQAVWIIIGACAFHFFMVLAFGRLQRFVGWLLLIAYAVFLYNGLPR